MYHWYNQFISLFDLCMNTRETVSTCINSTHILDICEACWTHQPYPSAQNPHVVICWICQFGLRLQKSPPQRPGTTFVKMRCGSSDIWDLPHPQCQEPGLSGVLGGCTTENPLLLHRSVGRFLRWDVKAIWFGRCQLIEGSKKVMGTSSLFLLIPSFFISQPVPFIFHIG